MRLISLSAFLFLTITANGQLFMSRDIKAAIDKGTRSLDGKPGKNYWQNHGVYDIDITAMPPLRIINGTESITYFNESPDTLRSPNVKLFINIHKPGASRDQDASPDYLTEGVIIDAASVNGEEIKFVDRNFFSANFTFRLPKPLLPHTSANFNFKWHYTISKQSGREGMIDSTTFFLAYFYPRIAVYDDYNGWDRMSFVDSHEFYSDFNDYTVTLNVPKNYIVTGTGTLQKPEKLLQSSFLKKYMDVMKSDKTINIVTKQDLEAKNITVQNNVNSWQFKATNIPDMAFAISDHYNWDGCSVVVDDATGRRAGAYAMYNDNAKDYHFVAQQARHALNWLSHYWPGVPYPYEKTTVVQGFAGMEYPMMANDESYPDTTFSRFVAEHEIAHTYMPFYMGINETRYGFMDEGWATTFEYLIGSSDLGKEKESELFKQFRVDNWINDEASSGQIPIITPGDAITGQGLGQNEYGKAALGYLAMKDLLGDDLFKKCLHAYMDRWHGKHPTPWDFFYTYNDVSGKDLNWFWKSWYFENSYIDLALKSATKIANGYEVKIENVGGMPAPVDITAIFDDGTSQVFHASPIIWEGNIKEATFKITTTKKIISLKADGNIFMDANTTDNFLKL